jgi:tryptophan synthase alpha chain
MNRIDQIFTELRQRGRRALMPFLTAGYPNLQTTADLLRAIDSTGASICELGIPFSDPIADGPVIQASMTRALEGGVDCAGLLEMVSSIRQQVRLGLVAMVSYSIVYRLGVQPFIDRAREAGFDGFIFPDLPLEEAEHVAAPVRDAGMTNTLLIAPTTPDDRARKIAAACSGFVYMVARTGITGERDRVPDNLARRVAQLREVTDLPIAVGFGISRPEHVRAVTEVADAAIVGSAVVKRITDHLDDPPEQLVAEVGDFVGELAGGL